MAEIKLKACGTHVSHSPLCWSCAMAQADIEGDNLSRIKTTTYEDGSPDGQREIHIVQ